jgi:CDGSH-type Zn-finger protein
LADNDEVVITPYRDGPLLVRGPFTLQDQDGNVIEVGRRTVALCRCGKSRMRPFCDGTHKVIRFRAPSALEDGRELPARFERFMREDPDPQ